MVGNSADETNFPHILLLPDTQVMNLRKASANKVLFQLQLIKNYPAAAYQKLKC